jgi:drug/metabolite transporter (DMT)-like permease
MNDRKPLDLTAFLCIAMLCSLWGGQQVLFKLSIHDIHPNMQIALRSGIGCVLLAALMWRKGISLALWRGPWREGMLVGVLFALEWWMIGEGLRHTSASHMVVFLYTAPIFTALGLHIWRPDERLSWWQWGGVFICFGGIGQTFLGAPPTQHLITRAWLGDSLALGAGLLWAATTIIIRCSGLARIAATQTTMYQLLGGALGVFLLCTVMGQTEVHWSLFLIGSIVGQGVVISFFSLLVWFWLLRHYLASRVSVFTFLSPLIGVGLSVWLLGEPLQNEFRWGALMVMIGVILVNLSPQTQRLNGA